MVRKWAEVFPCSKGYKIIEWVVVLKENFDCIPITVMLGHSSRIFQTQSQVTLKAFPQVLMAKYLFAGYPYYSNTGKAVIFQEGLSNWEQKWSMLIAQNVSNRKFGQSVSMNGNGTIVSLGAPEADCAMVCKYQVNYWTLHFKVDGDESSKFGWLALLVDSKRMIVGAIDRRDNNRTEIGSAYMYSLFPLEILQIIDGNESCSRIGRTFSML